MAHGPGIVSAAIVCHDPRSYCPRDRLVSSALWRFGNLEVVATVPIIHVLSRA